MLYLVVSLCGYFTYGDSVSSDILETYPHIAVVNVARVAIALVVVFSYPLQLHPARSSLKSIVNFCAEHCCVGKCGEPAAGNTLHVKSADESAGSRPSLAEESAHPDIVCRYGPTFGGSMSPDDSMHILITCIFLPMSFLVAYVVRPPPLAACGGVGTCAAAVACFASSSLR